MQTDKSPMDKVGEAENICNCGKVGQYEKFTDCVLCDDCNKELAESFEIAMCMDRSDYPEL